MIICRSWAARTLAQRLPPRPSVFRPHDAQPVHTATILHARSRPARSSRQTPESRTPKPSVTVDSIGLYTDTAAPNAAQLAYVEKFFRQPATFLFAATSFMTLPRDSLVPEIAFLGRSNVGKSSLLNALLKRPRAPAQGRDALARVSKRPGLTKEMNYFKVGRDGNGDGAGGTRKKWIDRKGKAPVQVDERWIGRGGLVVVDMPGYGFGSRDEWGGQILKFLEKRKQLRRVFVLVSSKELLTQTDMQLFQLLYEMNVPHQIVFSKVDKLLPPGKNPWSGEGVPEKVAADLGKKITLVKDQLREIHTGGGMKTMEDVLACSSVTMGPKGQPLGVAGVRWAVLQAAGLDCDESGRARTLDFGTFEPKRDTEMYRPPS